MQSISDIRSSIYKCCSTTVPEALVNDLFDDPEKDDSEFFDAMAEDVIDGRVV